MSFTHRVRPRFRLGHFVLLSLLGSFGCGSGTAAKPSPAEVPMYAGLVKTPAQLQADQALIETAEKQPGGRPAGSKHLVRRAWEAWRAGDAPTGLRRANQAWLLNPEEPEVYWVFGTILGSQQRGEESAAMYDRAVAKDATLARNPRFLIDKATTAGLLASAAAPAARPEGWKAVSALYQQASDVAPTDGSIPLRWAAALFNAGDHTAAWEKVHRAQALGSTVDPAFLAHLSARMPEPPKSAR